MEVRPDPRECDGRRSDDGTRRAVERAARDSYGKLVAYLAARTGDVAGAEDALSEAFAAALAVWQAEGVPRAPGGVAARGGAAQSHRPGAPPPHPSRRGRRRCTFWRTK